MSVFGKLISAAIQTVVLPVELVVDVASCGLAGIIADDQDGRPLALKRIQKIAETVEDAADEAAR